MKGFKLAFKKQASSKAFKFLMHTSHRLWRNNGLLETGCFYMIAYKINSNPQSMTRPGLTTEASFLASACEIHTIKAFGACVS